MEDYGRRWKKDMQNFIKLFIFDCKRKKIDSTKIISEITNGNFITFVKKLVSKKNDDKYKIRARMLQLLYCAEENKIIKEQKEFFLEDNIIAPILKKLSKEKDKTFENELEECDFTPKQFWGNQGYKQTLKQIIIKGKITKEKKLTIKNIEKEIPTETFKTIYEKYVLSSTEFEEWEKKYKDKDCEYCHISPDEIKTMVEGKQIRTKRSRGYSVYTEGNDNGLEVDKKDPFRLYVPANMVYSCYWCNNAKTDEFIDDEFKPIGEAIRKEWDRRLKIVIAKVKEALTQYLKGENVSDELNLEEMIGYENKKIKDKKYNFTYPILKEFSNKKNSIDEIKRYLKDINLISEKTKIIPEEIARYLISKGITEIVD